MAAYIEAQNELVVSEPEDGECSDDKRSLIEDIIINNDEVVSNDEVSILLCSQTQKIDTNQVQPEQNAYELFLEKQKKQKVENFENGPDYELKKPEIIKK